MLKRKLESKIPGRRQSMQGYILIYSRLWKDGKKVNSSDEGERGIGETGGGEGRNTNSYTEIGQKKKTDPFSLSNPL